jgi:hypothetical protein
LANLQNIHFDKEGGTISLKPLIVHTVPVYQQEDGEVIYGIKPIAFPPPDPFPRLKFLGWANIHEVELNGEPMFFLAVKYE